MKERPILMSAPMVRALLAGTKTQTRRSIPGRYIDDAPPVHFHRYLREHCRYGVPGDRLYVKEQHEFLRADGGRLACLYRADMTERALSVPDTFRPVFRGRPSIHMPRWASRITLEITDVRVERLQEISEDDAIAEGAKPYRLPVHPARESLRHVDGYQQLWESINGHGSWYANPLVWALTFKRVAR